jgi:hypothetical protein
MVKRYVHICQPMKVRELTPFSDGNYVLHDDYAILEAALIRLRDCDWVISLPDRMDAVREIARTALNQVEQTKCTRS